MRTLIDRFIGWPERASRYFTWFAPLIARIVVGWVFVLTGWGKLHNLPLVIENFRDTWGIPFPQLLAPVVAGVEFFGGLFLLSGFLTRISAGALAVVMLVAIKSAQWGEVNTFEDLLGLEETLYFTLFLWLAVAGPGALSVDYILQRSFGGTRGAGPA
ncbi:MAG TPA: DoxX family protein [Steroidobacteraceae bacterium]|nr:DoxX family protein [Steroidobacteraceae bacterium]